MERTTAKAERLLMIYSRLVNGDTLSKQELAQQFHVTTRSIQRDMESLRCFFAEQRLWQDIIYDRDAHGYRLERPAQSLLTNSEILSVCKILLESRSMRRDEMLPILDKLVATCVPEQSKQAVKELLSNEKFHYIEPHHNKRILHGLWEMGQASRLHGRKSKRTAPRTDEQIPDESTNCDQLVLFCYENLPSEGRNNPSCPRTGCLHYRKHGFRRSQAGYQAPNPVLSDVLDIHVFFCLD